MPEPFIHVKYNKNNQHKYVEVTYTNLDLNMTESSWADEMEKEEDMDAIDRRKPRGTISETLAGKTRENRPPLSDFAKKRRRQTEADFPLRPFNLRFLVLCPFLFCLRSRKMLQVLEKARKL